MSVYEFQSWLKYYNEYPFGDYRTDLREALTCVNLLAPHTKSNLSVKDFMLIPDKEDKEAKPVPNLVEKTRAMIRGMRPPNGK